MLDLLRRGGLGYKDRETRRDCGDLEKEDRPLQILAYLDYKRLDDSIAKAEEDFRLKVKELRFSSQSLMSSRMIPPAPREEHVNYIEEGRE
ncbi:hypothetical protein BGX34_011876 [Mortierella sp. NVP85]|nr:hypothetical protein BGX34_011876 [Mortierella sp. NVP85]